VVSIPIYYERDAALGVADPQLVIAVPLDLLGVGHGRTRLAPTD
jgi:hypothetical protein